MFCVVKLGCGRTGDLKPLGDTGVELTRLGGVISMEKETQNLKMMAPVLALGPHECWTCYYSY